MPNASYQAAIEFLYGRIDYERTGVPYQSPEFKLDRMRDLLERLGNPHQGLPCVHIAGTKGKGSTATMLAAIAQAAQLRTGLFTSPHLRAIEERITVDAIPIAQESLAAEIAEVRDAIARMDRSYSEQDRVAPTFFEIMTALAFLYFRRRQVQLAVLEVGLGGRLDSTNVCQPLVTAITSLSLDHVRQLGNSLTAIAREKAGIIKPQVPVVSGVTGTESLAVIAEVAARNNAPWYQSGREFAFTYRCLDRSVDDQPPASMDYEEYLRDRTWKLDSLHLAMRGTHQAANAAVACAIVQRLREQQLHIADSAIRTGLASARCPARVDLLRSRPAVILDVAHNLASVEALVEALPQQAFRRRKLVFAASNDKDISGMLRVLIPVFDTIVLTQFNKNPRATDPLLLARIVRDECQSLTCPCPELTLVSTACEAWNHLKSDWEPDDLICITGSFFLAAEMADVIDNDASTNTRSHLPKQARLA